MERPPKLTPRERSLVPFLVQGASRREIAEEFSLSEETVKLHIRSLLRKFDARNLRECFLDLQSFEEFYSTNVNQGHEYHHRTTSTLTIDADGIDAENVITSDIEAVFGDVKTSSMSSGITNGEVVSAEINNLPVQAQNRGMLPHWYEFSYDKIKREGERYSRTMRLLTKGAYLEPTEFQLLSIYRPTKTARIIVRFASGNLPKVAKSKLLYQGRPAHLPVPELQRQGNTLVLDIPNPRVHYSYLIEWTWDTPPLG